MGTGLQKIIQILTQTLQATVKEQSERKTIIFSDSRQDAAKYAVGLQWAHYRDMIRLIVIETMKKQTEEIGFLNPSRFSKWTRDSRRRTRTNPET